MDVAIESAIQRFAARNPKSKELFEQALQSLPGGNTRTLLYTPPFPVSIQRGEAYKVFDEDGHEYNDLTGDLTAGLYGHSHPRLQEALSAALYGIGLNLGATTRYEQRYASLLCARFGLDRLRFSNSGTEANIHCLAAARKFTGRRKVVVFRGAYHGGVLSFGTDIAPNNVDPTDWLLLQYNDVDGVKKVFEEHKDIAAVILEAVQSSGGAVSATAEFLKTIRDVTQANGALFILDEVVTSRLAVGGLKSTLAVQPDLVTLGKYLGGGMPFGAFGGREDIMSVYDPRTPGSLAHSGTFQNNCMMLNAGYVGLSEVYTEEASIALNKRGDDLRQQLNDVFRGTRFCVTGRGSLMCIHATTSGLRAEQISCKDDVLPVEDNALKELFWLEMLEAGWWVQSRGTIALSLVFPQEALDLFVEEVRKFCTLHRALIAI
ncbi:PLP-dependent transferase [Thozetella sp. PMI_491]|nr:PLP-dependent transferase [Thozetella sp. PMI_491]